MPATPRETGRAYDAIVEWFERSASADVGLDFVERAVSHVQNRRTALDVGCGLGGLKLAALERAGFKVTAMDVSPRMLARARARHPTVHFVEGDILDWEAPHRFDFILAWDSILHLPLDDQRRVVDQLCRALEEDGALLFTAGGVHGERLGTMAGQVFHYASLDEPEYHEAAALAGCRVLWSIADQPPEDHVVMAVQRMTSPI